MAIHLIDFNTEERSMTFRIDGVEKDITIYVYPEGSGIAIDYGDDGIGIPFKDAEWMKEFIEDKELEEKIIKEANGNKKLEKENI